jgi:hypothetical protein
LLVVSRLDLARRNRQCLGAKSRGKVVGGAGGPAGAEASQRGGADRSAGDAWLRAPEPQLG